MFIQSGSKRLAREMFIKMVIYQQRLESKQSLLARFVDIGTDLFVMASVCSYATGLARQKIGTEGASPIELADLFCCQARARIAGEFHDVRHNNDKKAAKIAKNILSDRYEWMENEIIK
jgi:hypothetical protein